MVKKLGKRTKLRRKHKRQWRKILIGIFGKLECSVCGYDKYFEALDFHHTQPELKTSKIGLIIREKPTPERIAEVKTCIILCANCHRELHARQNGE
jgi:predicted HNH restriction endonuclease